MRAALSEGRSSVRDMSTESRPGVVRVAGLGLSWVGVEASTMRGAEAVAVMRGCFHRRNRGTADLLRAMHVAGRATAGTGARRALLDDFSGDEVAGALGWSRSMASRWLDLADDLVSRLCEVLTAMDGGALDDAKARVVSEWTRDLSDDHAHALCADVLPWAPGLSVGALIERIQEVAVALDPDWAARREARARTRARVVGGTNPSGTANLSGYDLPVDEAVEALARVEAIAAEVRRRGVRIPVARLRATVYLRLLDGFCAGLDDDALVRRSSRCCGNRTRTVRVPGRRTAGRTVPTDPRTTRAPRTRSLRAPPTTPTAPPTTPTKRATVTTPRRTTPDRMATAPGSLAAPGSRSATPVSSRTALHPTAQTPTARRTSSTTLLRPVACVRGRSRSACACPQHSASTISRRAFRGGV